MKTSSFTRFLAGTLCLLWTLPVTGQTVEIKPAVSAQERAKNVGGTSSALQVESVSIVSFPLLNSQISDADKHEDFPCEGEEEENAEVEQLREEMDEMRPVEAGQTGQQLPQSL